MCGIRSLLPGQDNQYALNIIVIRLKNYLVQTAGIILSIEQGEKKKGKYITSCWLHTLESQVPFLALESQSADLDDKSSLLIISM